MILDKKQMTEEDIKLNYITPALQAKWGGRITMETRITDGRINLKGNFIAREKPKKADYVLYLNEVDGEGDWSTRDLYAVIGEYGFYNAEN